MTDSDDDSLRVGGDRRIDQISTRQDAVSDPSKFVLRYAPAITSYLNSLVRDEDFAQDILQDFLLKLIADGFVNRNANRGRFRDYLKVAIRNAAITELRRRKVRRTADVDIDSLELAADSDASWDDDWRTCLLDVAWRQLERVEHASETNFAYTVLKLAVDHPESDSASLANLASEQTEHDFSAASYRKQLSRARKSFGEFVRMAIAETLQNPTDEAIQEEVAELRLTSFLPS